MIAISRTFFLALLAATALLVASPHRAEATAAQINADANNALQSFVGQIGGARELAKKAAGVLVFPSVVKAGLVFGGEYGEGVMIIHGQPAGYYNLVSGSFGFQLGVQERSVIIMFMTESALDQFNRTAGWKVGVDGSVAIITVGAGGSIDSNNIASPGIAFLLH